MNGASAAASTTPAELARLIARGDRRRAAALLVREHAPAVFALCRAMVRDARLAEDLSQDAFARAFGALEGFRGEASPRTWLLAIARNRCLDHIGRARRAPWAGHEDAEPDEHAADEPPPFDLLSRREDAERAMAVLGESERALVVLHFGHGMGYPELADSFGLREGAVRMRISRALAKMREALREDALADMEDDLALDAEPDAASSSADRAMLGEWGADADGDEDEVAETALRSSALAPAPAPARSRGGGIARRSRGASELSEPPPPPPIFDAIRDEVPSMLSARLDALVGTM